MPEGAREWGAKDVPGRGQRGRGDVPEIPAAQPGLHGRPLHAAHLRGAPVQRQGGLEGEPRHLHERTEEPAEQRTHLHGRGAQERLRPAEPQSHAVGH